MTEDLAFRNGKEVGNYLGAAMTDLSHTRRLMSLEVGCSPTSLLTSTLQETTKDKDSAIRCSYWNGCDLETASGIKKVLQTIDTQHPRHVWISTECGPYSPTQNMNQQTSEQIQALEEKQTKARKQYHGGLVVSKYAQRRGAHVHWEWASRCRAWNLKEIEDWMKTAKTSTAIVSGCNVNLRNEKRQLLGKSWRVESTCPNFSQGLDLRCKHGRGAHAQCEGRATRASAYYTKELAKRIVHYILHPQEVLTDIMTNNNITEISECLAATGESSHCACQDSACLEGLNCGFCPAEEDRRKYLQDLKVFAGISGTGGPSTPGPLNEEEKRRCF